jgi:hypothetical protein
MEIRQIKSLLTVAEILHFGKEFAASSPESARSQSSDQGPGKRVRREVVGSRQARNQDHSSWVGFQGRRLKNNGRVRGGLPPNSVDRSRKTRVNSTWIHLNRGAGNSSDTYTQLPQTISRRRVLAPRHSHQRPTRAHKERDVGLSVFCGCRLKFRIVSISPLLIVNPLSRSFPRGTPWRLKKGFAFVISGSKSL